MLAEEGQRVLKLRDLHDATATTLAASAEARHIQREHKIIVRQTEIAAFAGKMLDFAGTSVCSDTDVQMLQECQKELAALGTSGAWHEAESTTQGSTTPSLLELYEEANEQCTQLELLIKAESRAAEDLVQNLNV